jgi:hypothetical protein
MVSILKSIRHFFGKFFSEYRSRRKTKPNYEELYRPNAEKQDGSKKS